MLDLSREVQWWEEWQMRILVLGSLFLQFVLFVGSWARHARALKPFMWLAYISSDAVAIYALSTLFNRHKAPASSGTTTSPVQLELLWAPVLLCHLGGLHRFMAYSVEDNELWRRLLVTLVLQTTVALYVFCRSWSGSDKRLLQAAILLFISGILKCIQKLLVLRSASFSTMISSSVVYPRRRRVKRSIYLILYSIISIQTAVSIDDAASLREQEEHDLSLEEYIQKARELALVTEVDPNIKSIFSAGHGTEEKRFVDLSAPYSRRLRDMSLFLKFKKLELLLIGQLSYSFAMIYTSWISFGICSVLLFVLFLPFISLTSAVLFHQSQNGGYKESDVKVTYILLWCSTGLEFWSTFAAVSGHYIYSITAAQHNMISFAARKSMPTRLMRVSALVCLKEYINEHWYIRHKSLSFSDPKSIKLSAIRVVVKHLRDGWNHFIVDAASYRRFNHFRGQWTMSRHKVCDPRLLWIFQVPFDLSVLIWHLATDLCLHHPKTSSSSTNNNAAQESFTARKCSKVVSDYMIYLLLIHPEMLMLGSRPGLFTTTCDDIEIMLKSVKEPPSRDLGTVVEQILRAARSPEPYTDQIGPWVLKACKLAEDLMELLGDEEERWDVIQGVWLEMLCYSAGRCRGYLHAKSMGEGVEFLSYIWLILWHMGMETCADSLQRPDPIYEDVNAISQV